MLGLSKLSQASLCGMIKLRHRGDAILEWVVLGVLVIAVVGIVAYSIANNAGTEGTNLASWIGGLDVPTSP